MSRARRWLGPLALLIAVTGLTAPAFAVIEVRGEYLYLRPSFCNNDYAILANTPGQEAPEGHVQRIRSTYRPGFRVSVGYLDCCKKYDVALAYTHLHQTRADRVVADPASGLWPTFGRPGNLNVLLTDSRARARSRFCYDAVDLQVGHRSVHEPGCLCLRAWAGLHYANLERSFEAQYEGQTINTVLFRAKNDSKVWGIGPKVGADMRLDLFCQLGIGGSFSVALLAGDQRRHFDQEETLDVDSTIPTNLRFKRGLAFFTEVNARLGLNYCYCCSCLTVLVEVGYEFINYLNALERVNFTGPASTFNILCQDARMDGLYVSVRVSF